MTHPRSTSQSLRFVETLKVGTLGKRIFLQKSIFMPRGEKGHDIQETKVCLCMRGNEITGGEREREKIKVLELNI